GRRAGRGGSTARMQWARAVDGALRSLSRVWRWHNRRRIRPHNLKPPSRKKLLFEMLEPRLLLSADPVVSVSQGGVLSAQLTDGDDHVLVEKIGGNASDGYDVRVALTGYDAQIFSGVRSIIADGLDGDDSFMLVDITADVAVSVAGGAGDDTL